MQKFQIHQFWEGQSKRPYVLPEEILNGVCKPKAVLNVEVSLTSAPEATNLLLDSLQHVASHEMEISYKR